MSSIYFILPDYNQVISGSNWYNQQLVNAMQKESAWPIHLLTLEKLLHDYKNIETGLFIVDTLYLHQIKEILRGEKKGQKFLLLVHSLQSIYPLTKDTIYEWINEKDLLIHLDGFITTCDDTANYLRRYRLKMPIVVIPPALSFIPKQLPLRKSNPIKALLTVNVIDQKGVLPFLKILQGQVIDPQYFSLEIVGDLIMEKKYANKCLQLVKNTSLHSYCRFLGPLSPQAMQDKYRQANLLIATSLFETYEMTLQEAVAWKLPVLAIKGRNTTYHIQNGLNGYLFDNINDLVVRLKTLIKNQEWMDLLLKQTAQTKAKKSYTWKDAAKRLKVSMNVGN